MSYNFIIFKSVVRVLSTILLKLFGSNLVKENKKTKY